ncbi:CPBP family intramembrane metalloprotease [Lachnospiraceae bacterium MD1]|uniref:CPBP family intramembrane metalloprotease n=1 Tax=Variimorphobacter saccharofermentans TaxID=2755051 RepID=A0A839JZ28_9FIRM|nr:CPBP family intramembrane glutamic endopeptidase [Variimorphobacter saccharofermentans]MBB2181899.1 CPBP family intramembrane metalloprotease [Variimorphobacter saccharofermentans]
MNKRDKIALAIFVFVTLTAGIFGYMLDQVLTDQPEGNSLGMGLWLVLPLLTGIVLRIINKDLKEIGARTNLRNNIKWYGVAVLVYPFIMLISIIIAKAGGGLTIGKFESGALFALMLTTFFGSCIKNIFEEFAWRGCLVPYLEKTKMNDWLLYFTSGLVWGMWHITYYMFFLPDEYFTETSRPMMVVIGIVLMIFWSPLFVELRRLTNSVWPCVILHAMEDAVPTLLFVTTDVFRIKKSLSVMIDPISGFVTTAILLLIGLSLRKYRIKKNYVTGAG